MRTVPPGLTSFSANGPKFGEKAWVIREEATMRTISLRAIRFAGIMRALSACCTQPDGSMWRMIEPETLVNRTQERWAQYHLAPSCHASPSGYEGAGFGMQ